MAKPTILILDDEFLVAMALARNLEEEGLAVAGPYARLDEALAALDADAPDAAFLDINLGAGKTSQPLAEALEGRGIPFLFVTGYSEVTPLRQRFPMAKFLSKPLNAKKAAEEAWALLR